MPVYIVPKRGTPLWHETYPIYYAPLSRSARRSFASFQKWHRNHRPSMCEQKLFSVWSSCRSVFMSVQKLSDMVNINLIWYLQKWWFNKSFLFPLESLRVTCYEVGGKTTHFLVQNNETSLTKQYWKAGTHTHISQKPAEILAWVSRDFLLSSV